MENQLFKLIYKANTGRLYEELVKIPRARWSMELGEAETWMTLAARGNNPLAIIELWKHDPSLVNSCFGTSPLYWACHYELPRIAELLLVLGAQNRLYAMNVSIYRYSPCIKTLIANGSRLHHTLSGVALKKKGSALQIKEFEQRVVQCRDIIVILLGLRKWRRKLYKLDKFLIRQELAPAIWSTRYT